MNPLAAHASAIASFDRALDQMFARSTQNELDRIHRRSSEIDKAEQALREDFLELAQTCDLKAQASFAPMLDLRSGPRPATLEDVIDDAVDNHDFIKRMYSIFLRAAKGEQVQVDSQELLGDMAACYASRNVE